MIYQQYLISLLVLLLPSPTFARVANDLDKRDGSLQENGGLFRRFRQLMNQKKDIIQCNEDDIWTLMGSNLGVTACSILFSSPNATITATGTITEWTTDVTATVDETVIESTDIVSITTTITMTQMVAAKYKRDIVPAPAPTAPPLFRRRTLQDTIVALEEWQDGNINSSILLSWAPEIASACSCRDSGPLFTSTILDIVTTTTMTQDAYLVNITNEDITVTVLTTEVVMMTPTSISILTEESSAWSSGGEYPLVTTITTAISNSTVEYITTILTNGSGGSGFGTGSETMMSVTPASPGQGWNYSLATGGTGTGWASGESIPLETSSTTNGIWNFTLVTGGGGSSYITGGSSTLPSEMIPFPNVTSSVYSVTESASNSSVPISGILSGNSTGFTESEASSAPFSNVTTATMATTYPNSTCLTTIIYSTISIYGTPPPGCSMICGTTAPFPSQAYNPSFTIPTPSSAQPPTTASTIPSSPADPPIAPRAPNTPATPAQIAAACAYDGNMVYNSGFERTTTGANGQAEPQDYGWQTNDAGHVHIVDAALPPGAQGPPGDGGGSRVARFTVDGGRAAGIGILWQPLTLCPNVSYVVGGWARQNQSADGCSADFYVGGEYVGSLNPDETWTNIWTDAQVYTVGPLAANASVNLEIRMECTGLTQGKSGVLELDELSLEVPVVVRPKE